MYKLLFIYKIKTVHLEETNNLFKTFIKNIIRLLQIISTRFGSSPKIICLFNCKVLYLILTFTFYKQPLLCCISYRHFVLNVCCYGASNELKYLPLSILKDLMEKLCSSPNGISFSFFDYFYQVNSTTFVSRLVTNKSYTLSRRFFFYIFTKVVLRYRHMIHGGPLWITKTDLFKHACDNTIKFRKAIRKPLYIREYLQSRRRTG